MKIKFNRVWYIKNYHSLLSLNELLRPKKHYYRKGWKMGLDPSSKFSTSMYLFMYPDVGAANICPLKHYNEIGRKEERKIIPSDINYYKRAKKLRLFDEQYYLKQIKNTAELKNLRPFSHYLLVGWRDNLNPSSKFSTRGYLDFHQDVRETDANPLLHYLMGGREEGRLIFSVKDELGGAYKKRPLMAIPRVLGRLIYMGQIIKRRRDNKKILVVLHLYYLNSWKEIKNYLDNLGCYNYDLYITTELDKLPLRLKKKIEDYKPGVKFVESGNLGFDVAPFLFLIKKLHLDDYDMIIKLQSKGTAHRTSFSYGKLFKDRDWFLSLFNGVVGAFNIHQTVKKLSNKEIGMVGTKELIAEDDKAHYYYTKLHLEKIGVKVPKEYHFIAGSCFGIRKEVAEELKKIKLERKYVTKSRRGSFTLAHALERVFGIKTREMKLSIEGNRIFPWRWLKWHKKEKELEAKSCKKLLDDKRFIIDPDCYFRCFDGRFMDSYEVKDVRVGDIKVRLNMKSYGIDETPPYLYLKNRDKKAYIRHCREKREVDYLGLDDTEFKNLKDDDFIKRFKRLETSFDNGYDKKHLIILDGDGNYILDGMHRTSIIAYKYGLNKKVRALIINYVVLF